MNRSEEIEKIPGFNYTLVLLPDDFNESGRKRYKESGYDAKRVGLEDFDVGYKKAMAYEIVMFTDPDRETDHVILETII